jgi:uncharacterized integral membrane protein
VVEPVIFSCHRQNKLISGTKQQLGMKNITVKQIINISVIIILLIFSFQNLDSVKVKLLFFAFELPLVILIAIVFFVGYFTARVFHHKKGKTP